MDEETNPLEMGDEEFMNLMNSPSVTPKETQEEPEQEEEEVIEEVEEETLDDDASNDEETSDPATDDDSTPPGVPSDDPSLGSKDQETVAEDTDTPDAEAKGESDATDYKALYEQVLAPFKANGKLIQPKSVDEVIQLMQMGANFTRKMQDIAPYRKTLMMLENNGLLDEQRLSYLIDLDKKNPEAIKKLVKDAGIDPLDIDTDNEPAYQVGNRHRVSDQEVAFRTVLDDLKTSPTGQETIQIINGWDQASKELLWEQPAAMTLINEQKENGIYDQISSEIDRLKVLGVIPVTMPFLEAYTRVGDSLRDAGSLAPVAKHVPTTPQAPIATKVAAPKPKVNNSDKASAAAQSKSTVRKAKPLINPLALSDDDFMKQFANRL